MELIPPINNYTIKEGTQLEDITCRANCTPACSFSWLKNGQDYQVKPIISLGQVSVSDAGTYKCTASNGQNRTEVSFVLDVQCEFYGIVIFLLLNYISCFVSCHSKF